MIKYNPKFWFRHIFSIRRSDTIFIIWKELVALILLTLGLTYVELTYLDDVEPLGELIAVYSLTGFVLSLLLVFRTNTAYERWWEGRKKWGELVNNTRNLAIKVAAMVEDKEDREYFSRMISNYAYAMKEHLRLGVKFEELDLSEDEENTLASKDHVPNMIAQWMYTRFQKVKAEGQISGEDFIVVDVNLKTFSDIIGACERIKNTPMPYSYNIFLKKFIFIYVTTIPLAFVGTFGYFSSLVAGFIFYILVSMEILAEEIEDPFGLDDNDLPTDDLSAKIKANVAEVLK